MVLVIRVRPIYIERLLYGLAILLLLSSNLYFYFQAQDTAKNGGVIVAPTESELALEQAASQNQPAEFEELDVAALEKEVKEEEPEPEPEEEEEPEPVETCTDGIKNQDEEGIDCGGVCKACPSSEPATPASSGKVEFEILDYDYEWVDNGDDDPGRGKLTNVKFTVFNDLGEEIDDAEIEIFFYGSNEDLELKESVDATIELPSISNTGTHRDVIYEADDAQKFTFCCVGDQSTTKTLRMVLKSEEHDLNEVEKVTVS